MKKGNKANDKFKKIIIPTVIVSYGISLNANNIAYAREINNNEVSLEISNLKELEKSVTINEENFPDENFLAYIKENFDIDNDGILSNDEILEVKSIAVKYKAIKSLKGIENFPNLTYINADYNYIESLDLSKNYNLEVVLCNNNKLTNIDLPNDIENYKLYYLDIFSNVLTEVDLSNLKALEFLHIDDNRITHLDLSDNPLSEDHGFVAQNNYIEEITLPNNGTEYEWIKFLGTQLFPKGKEVGYKVKWYLDKEKTQELDPKETITCSGQTLYAEYVPITYTIEFNPGAGNGDIKTQEFTYGVSENLLKNTYTRDGYVFNGWKDINGKIYKNESEILNLTDVDGKVIKLTATWTDKDYKDESTIEFKDESLDKVYDGKQVENPLVEKTGSSNEVEFKWYEMKDSKWEEMKDLPINAGRYKVVASVSGNEFYEGAEKEKEFTILKAKPNYNIPENLSANYGDILEDIDLPEGFTFEEDLNIKVGDIGLNNFKVTYTPKDTLNYEIINNIDITIKVEKVINNWIIEPNILGWVYGDSSNVPISKAKYGDVKYLFSNEENGVYKEIVENLDSGTWYMKAIVEEGENYTGLEKIVSFDVEKKNITSDNIDIPETNEETDLEKLEIKDGEKVLEKDRDYDIEKIQEENVVTIKIIFKGNYSGEIIKTYTIEENKPSDEDKPVEEEKPGDNDSTDEEGSEVENPSDEDKPQISINDINISNGVNNTNEFTYGDKIIIKFNINFENELLSRFLSSLNNGEREVALFANGVQVTESQKVINGQEVIFEYDTSKQLIDANGDVELVIAFINENKDIIEITKTNIKLNKKESTSSDINIPEVDKETDLENLIIKDGDRILEEGKDFDVVKIQEGNIVTIKIVFKGNYSGEIIRTYIIEESNPNLPEQNPEDGKPVEEEIPETEEPNEENNQTNGEDEAVEDKPIEGETPEIEVPENEEIEEISGDKIPQVDNSNNKENESLNNNESILPNTGSAISSNILLAISSMITAIGTVLLKRKNK